MKKLVSILFSLLFVAMAFAQEVKSTGITDQDVKNYAKNFKTITKELDKLKDDDFSKIDVILEKNGISGPNRFQKFDMLMKCTEVAVYDYQISSNPETAKLLQSMGMDPLAETRKLINQKDFDVVNANVELLADLMS